MLLHQITSFSHSVAVKRQVTNRCSRDSSFTPQKEQAEESIFPIFFKNVFVTCSKPYIEIHVTLCLELL